MENTDHTIDFEDNQSIEETIIKLKHLRNTIDNIRNSRIEKIEKLRLSLTEKNENVDQEIEKLREEIKKIENDPKYVIASSAKSNFYMPGGELKFKKKDAQLKIDKITDKIEKLKFEKIENVDHLILETYLKNICEIFGHEYVRDNDGDIKYDSRGGSFAQYTDSWYEDERELISPAISSTNYGICKYCGQEFEEELQFPYDYEYARNMSMIRLSKKKKNK